MINRPVGGEHAEIVAYGGLADEELLLHDAFDGAFGGCHELRGLRLFLNRDIVPIASGHEVVLSSVNDTPDAKGAVLARRGRHENDQSAVHRLK
ncbi:hypothetical protein P1S61_38330 [Streptomyces sp. ME08-AFT2]|uniref:hypothetical protein n=1 Tax=Streptomyces TaxID=1883 RepID=UPI000A389351|nr:MULTISPECIES: hypothetical protein [Streptomyces]MDX2760251.1 hypothetical protein [Streptomyces europaeiscabiei]MDX3314817.1 hypothetical protein [Streptomyces sp. ME08-AFT2]MDX3632538.1 hypothetical protein [Streptomyces europaeiscabiei]MDX3646821.1 hypothetical protein [Streptomyces europaeiscabiei]